MKKIRLIAGALALTMLAGCGAAADPDDLAYQAADIKRDSELLTVDGQGITAEEYLFWLMNAISQQKQYGYLADDSAWEESLGTDGTPTAEALKADALEVAKLYRVIESKAAEMGVTLTDEQKTQVEEEMASVAQQLGGEEELQAWLDARCISKEGFTSLNQVYYLNEGVRAKLEEAGELTVTDADLDAFIEEQGIYAAKHILISTRRTGADGQSYEEYTDEEKAAAAQLAQDLRRQMADAGDSEEKFDELMNEYSEDGRGEDGALYYPDGYTYVYSNETAYGLKMGGNAPQMVAEFEEGAKALAVGEISEPIQTDYGYHIILRVDVDREQAKTDCSADYKFNQLTQQWLEAAEVKTTKAYDELDPHSFYTRLQDIVAAKEAARASESPAESTPVESGAVESQTPAASESPAQSAPAPTQTAEG